MGVVWDTGLLVIKWKECQGNRVELVTQMPGLNPFGYMSCELSDLHLMLCLSCLDVRKCFAGIQVLALSFMDQHDPEQVTQCL